MRLLALLALPAFAARDLQLSFAWPEGLDQAVRAEADTTPPTTASWRVHTARVPDGLRIWTTDHVATDDPWRALPAPWPELVVDARGGIVRMEGGPAVAERWSRLVGVWSGASFGRGEARTWTEARALPWTGWAPVDTTLTASWTGRDRGRARLSLLVAPDPAGTLAALTTLGGAATTATVVETMALLTDPETLLPVEELTRREQRVDGAVSTITTTVRWGP